MFSTVVAAPFLGSELSYVTARELQITFTPMQRSKPHEKNKMKHENRLTVNRYIYIAFIAQVLVLLLSSFRVKVVF